MQTSIAQPLQQESIIDVVNSVSGKIAGTVSDASPAQVAKLCETARESQPKWAAIGFAQRGRILADLRRWLVNHRHELIEVCVAESGRLRDDIMFVDVLYPCDALSFWIKNAKKYMADEKVRTHGPLIRGRRVYTRYKPVGVVGVIAPWNFPVGLGFGDAIPALMAGNAAIVKPSELTPLSSLIIERGWKEIGAPAGVLQVATGRGATGQALIANVDMIQFTGSVKTGRKVAEQAARRLIPASLELGGKDPMLVLADADLERAANLAVRLGLFNSGQACISVERIYAEAPIYDAFVEKVVSKVSRVRIGIPTAPGELEYGAMIDPRQINIVESQIADALAKGARLLAGGKRSTTHPHVFEPTVLIDVDHTMDVMREETFGPIIPVMKVSSAEAGLKLANDSNYGLGASVISQNAARAERLAWQMDSGSVCVNDAVIHGFVLEAPFGGVKESGLGGRHGPRGIKKYCDAQTVVVTSKIAARLDDYMGWPNSPRKAKLTETLVKYLFGR